ncbi:methylated-DNA-[protein]-cysteine S-methyltransferase [Stackebrandtia endophytica]|uniref:Methylated-DNA--protein-cysteine methyltransferase n=1 Tax=Stackebrandtia endophytica TaxID=1496996 RepID=A0A543APP0_9ACTN|nr:methylated-DNA--[protein]-cysteine S-methyltransferase [Stackebrandtia endophytica]TQL74540.1 methylated-DNA-[protein]-cysteine S-methyltransferase [Stackebrandtia endophytica]
MNRVFRVVESPVGLLTLVAEDDRLVGLYLEDQRYRPADAEFGVEVTSGFESLEEQLGDYFAGRLQRFDVPLGFRGTPFQERVWTALLDVPYGTTVTYGQLAESLGKPTASRAVGAANGRNRMAIVVPCHRVVGADGSLTGYAGGVERKRRLLGLEGGREVFGVGGGVDARLSGVAA